MNITAVVKRPNFKAETFDFDVQFFNLVYMEIAKKMKCSLVVDKEIYNADGTVSTSSQLFFGDGIKDKAIITLKNK